MKNSIIFLALSIGIFGCNDYRELESFSIKESREQKKFIAQYRVDASPDMFLINECWGEVIPTDKVGKPQYTIRLSVQKGSPYNANNWSRTWMVHGHNFQLKNNIMTFGVQGTAADPPDNKSVFIIYTEKMDLPDTLQLIVSKDIHPNADSAGVITMIKQK